MKKTEKVNDNSRKGRMTFVSKRKNLMSSCKVELMLNVCQSLMLNEITTGGALKRLRVELLSLNQEQYAKMIGGDKKNCFRN